MLETPVDVREQLLEHLFPELRYGGDSDIERYFELRNQGRTLDALSMYKNRLVPRYPDQEKRIVLLKLYRQHSPLLAAYLKLLLLERADSIIRQLCHNIDALTARIATVNMKDTYAVLKAMELSAHLLPDDQEKARAAARTYQDYSRILDYKTAEMDRLCYLLDEFYDQTGSDTAEGADFLAMSMATEAARQKEKEEAAKQNFFDLSRIDFDEKDIQRIEIPAGIERNEDRALAYCFKYWLKVADPAFERIIRLYSRKYDTQHYRIFNTIKICRLRKYNDDEILSMVTSCITTEYSYTVQGDLYMQQAWKILKARLYGADNRSSGMQRLTPNVPSTVAPTTASVKLRPAVGQPTQRTKVRPAMKIPATTAATPGDTAAATKQTATHAAGTTTGGKATTASITKAATSRQTANPAKSVLPKQAKAPHYTQKASPGLSVSDYIRKLSGSAYDVYREAFMKKIGISIREYLTGRKHSRRRLDQDELKQAEALITGFIMRNYTNSYMDWAGSAEKAALAETGADLPNLEPVIKNCYDKIANRP
ncbi:MAG: hypothetical protein KKI09_08100 [Spirochaetes bacterium]|nr:hypothetical protein [Spirochaetota bacterium]MBU0955373.1 hypothetical protein [Spirochaetota bacterium]